MLKRIFYAFVRSVLVVLMIVTPSIMLPHITSDSTQIVALVALFAGALTFFEYVAVSPGLIEFRDAPPFNRIRFISLFLAVFFVSIICSGLSNPTAFTRFIFAIGDSVGQAMDFTYSPVQLMVLALPSNTTPEQLAMMRSAAGICYLTSLITLAVFVLLMQLREWPTRHGAFNFWINLPTFDPTSGGDVVKRLKRDGRLNIIIGFVLPFVMPFIILSATSLFGEMSTGNYQSLVWTVAAWTFLPSSLFMRGIAMGRIADMIAGQRREAYADANMEQLPA